MKFLTELASSKGYEVKGIYEEHISGATSNKERKVLADCLNDAKENCIDLILFSELSRCGRAIWEVSETIKFCAEKERENIYFRLSQGRELAKAKGVKMGRKAGSTKSREQKEQEYAKVIKLLRKGESLRNVAKLCDVSLSSVQRVKKEFCL